MPEKLLSNQTADGPGTPVRVPPGINSVTIDVGGVFGGATVTASVQATSAGPAVDQVETWSAEDSKILERPGPYDLVLTVASSSGTTDLDSVVEFHRG